MVTLPAPFTATKYPGYFWNVEEQKLYSIKITGELRQLQSLLYPNYFNHLREPAYRVSVKGRRTFLPLSYLEKLKIEDSEIPLHKG